MPQPAAPPLTIAHRYGNRLDRLEEAFATGVDYVEADVWLYRGRLEVRHEKTAGPLPVLWDRWSLRPGRTPRLSLAELFSARGRGRLFLDLKGGAAGLAEAVAAAVEAADAREAVAFSGRWQHLDRLGRLLPDLSRFYSVGSRRRLRALAPRLERRSVACVSIDSRIVREETVGRLRACGVETVVAWAVKTHRRARELLDWGMDGITSDDLALLVAVREGRLGAGG